MTLNALKERKKVLTASKRKKIKLSETRRKTILKRWNSEKGEDVDDHTTVNDSDSTDDPKPSSDDNDEGSNADEGDDPAVAISRATVYCYKAHLLSMFVTNPVDNLKLFIMCMPHFKLLKLEKPKSINLSILGTLNKRQLQYRKQMVISNVLKDMNIDSETREELFIYWHKRLFEDRLIEFIITNNWDLPSDYIPKSVTVSNMASEIGKRFLKRRNTAEAQRIQGVSYVIAVAKEAGLSIETFHDINMLSDATNCSQHFSRLVLQAIESKTENDLLQRNLRCDSIKATHWPNAIYNFMFQPENTCAVPGQASVSVWYRVRRPKYILLDLKENIATKFKTAFPECKFGISLIIREFPQNAVSATSRDMERNTCPYHANARRILRCLHSNQIAKEIPILCRKMCATSMCTHDNVIIEEPLT